MNKQLHVISTGKQNKEIFIQIIEDTHPYIDFIHIRERSWTAQEFIDVVQTLIARGVPSKKLIINDRVDVAHVTKCGGVQLAYHSMDVAHVKENFPQLRVGCSVHSVKEAVKKEKDSADFVLYGHVFSTLSKEGIPPKGVGKLQQIVTATEVPVIAIGGITPKHVPSVIKSGADGIAVLSGILLADNPLEAAKQYRDKLNRKG